jgi:GSH-dependent disulfide-bond oxidoreductase
MIKFYYNLSPDPMKVALLLEELELSYESFPVDTRKKQQLLPEYRRVNPNGKVPALQDEEVTIFDSNAILLYLADREGQFVPKVESRLERASALSWLMLIASDIGPASAQAIHFRYVSKESSDHALARFDLEAHRAWTVVEQHLATHAYILGRDYSIADMALWGWARILPYVLGTGDATWARYPNVKRLSDAIYSRPAASRVEALKTKHSFRVARRYRPEPTVTNNAS